MRSKKYDLFIVAILSSAMLGAAALWGCDQGKRPEVVMIGDSLLAMSGCIPGRKGIQQELEALSGHAYRFYAKSGAMLAGDESSMPVAIPIQYEKAKADDPDIRTAIMNGGANDILMHYPGICADARFGAECMAHIDEITMRTDALLQQMLGDGVENIVFVSYLNGSGFDHFNKAIDYGMLLAKQTLAKYDGVNGFKAKFVDTRPYQKEHPEIDWLCIDQTHPTMEASGYMAAMIWETMETEEMVR